MSEHMIRRRTALVAEDHGIYRRGLANLLRGQIGFEHVIESASLDDAVRIIGENDTIDLATFDLQMPGMHGASSLHGIRQTLPGLITIVITGSERRGDILAALAAGVHGYLPKSLDVDVLNEAIESVLLGHIYVPWSISVLPAQDDIRLDVSQVVNDRVEHRLTARQHDVLRLLRSRRSNKQIARELGLTENTVKAHTAALYRALGIKGRDEVDHVSVGEP